MTFFSGNWDGYPQRQTRKTHHNQSHSSFLDIGLPYFHTGRKCDTSVISEFKPRVVHVTDISHDVAAHVITRLREQK